MMLRTTLSALLLAAAPAAALADDCPHSAPRSLALDLAGVKAVRIETNQHDVRLRAAPGASHVVSGRACAGKPQWLEHLTVTQERHGDTLVVRARREVDGGLSTLFGNNRASLELTGTVPDDVLVQLVVGSGDGEVEGAAAASADVGSGDAILRRVRGAATAKVGSGDIEIDGAGSLKVLSIGSGDLKARDIGGRVEVGSIGSGDFALDGARGDVRIGSIGSGDAGLRNVSGNVHIESIGSGDAGLHDVSGAVRIDSIGSGGAEVRGAASLSVGRIGSGDVDHRGVAGTVDLPREH